MKVYIEPKPKARLENESINHYEIEKDGGSSVDNRQYKTQKEANESAKRQGHNPILCARVRVTDKGRPDHWRNCE
ncbi:MAG: hypothetical protein KGM16_11170 [Bacteroidota bacterium]|nr:hypothetical protein [Bacteroidota bacterium]